MVVADEPDAGSAGQGIADHGVEFWAVFDALAPGRLGSREEFAREWCTTGYGGENREAWFDGFDDARQRSTIALPGTPYGEPGYRFWFILRDRRPIACLEATGRIWSEVGDEHDLGDNPTARAISDAADSILGNA